MARRRGRIVHMAVCAAGMLLAGNLGCSAFGIRSEEEYRHDVIVKDGRFEIRAYEPCIVATTTMTGDMKEVVNPSFNRLAGYIFGDNTARDDIDMTVPVLREEDRTRSEKIAMTVPVTREPVEEGWTMSFVMPAAYTMGTLPRPNDDSVRLEPRPAVTRAVYRYSGLQRAADLVKYGPQLVAWAESQGFRVRSEAILAAYDPPWTIWFLRRNEVFVEVETADAPAID